MHSVEYRATFDRYIYSGLPAQTFTTALLPSARASSSHSHQGARNYHSYHHYRQHARSYLSPSIYGNILPDSSLPMHGTVSRSASSTD